MSEKLEDKSKEELIDIIVNNKHSNNTPPFFWQRKKPIKPNNINLRKFFNITKENYAPMDCKGFILPEDHWETIKEYIDYFYELSSKNDFDIDRHNLEILAKTYNIDYRETKRKTSESNSKNVGSVYLMEGDNYYKIGKAKDPISRHKTLSVKLPFEVEIVHTVESNQYGKLEKFLHEKFADKRTNGEWFKLDEDDIEYIKNLEGDEYND